VVRTDIHVKIRIASQLIDILLSLTSIYENHYLFGIVLNYSLLPICASQYIMTATHWTIKSAWSKAGVGTNIVLELIDATTANAKTNTRQFSKEALSTKKKPARIAFDMGATPCFDDAIPAKYVFLSHGHVDHVGALFSHARAHAVSCGG